MGGREVEEDAPRVAHSAPDVTAQALPCILGRRVISAPICERPVRDKRWQAQLAVARLERKRRSREQVARSGKLGHFATLTLGALGVVFGDIGTSPLYTLTGVFVDALHTGHPTPAEITSIFSMVFWALTWVVTVKYVGFVMRVSHHGEGGTFALLQRILSHSPSARPRTQAMLTFMAMLGCSLIIGDGCISPAISVLGALEGIPLKMGVTEHALLASAILFFIFLIQRRGSQYIGVVAGPVTVVWFLTIAALGIYNLASHPDAARQVACGLSPSAFYDFWVSGTYRGVYAWRSLAGVVLAVTGAEALYADMGHFGAKPISAAWLGLVYPCLVLQYMGQAAALCVRPEGVHSPFYNAVPHTLKWPVVMLATCAAIIASQALISGLFSLLSQAHALKLLPRILVLHTNPDEQGQVYIPEANWLLCVLCVAIALSFRTSTKLGGAYGITVTSTFMVTTTMFWFVLRRLWHWRVLPALLVIFPMLTVDTLLWSANLLKVVDSGWVPVVISTVSCIMMHTYSWGRKLEESVMSEEVEAEIRQWQATGAFPDWPSTVSTRPALHALLGSRRLVRTDRAAVFLTPYEWRVPRTVQTLAQLLGCLPKTIVLLSVRFEEVPFVSEARRASFEALGVDVFSIVLHFGYAEPLTAQRLALQRSLASVCMQHVRSHSQLQPLVDLGLEGARAARRPVDLQPGNGNGAAPTNGGAGKCQAADEAAGPSGGGGPGRPPPPQRPCGPTFVLHKVHYAARSGVGRGLWDRLRIALYSFQVLNARKSVHFFGLEGSNTMEISVVRFL